MTLLVQTQAPVARRAGAVALRGAPVQRGSRAGQAVADNGPEPEPELTLDLRRLQELQAITVICFWRFGGRSGSLLGWALSPMAGVSGRWARWWSWSFAGERGGAGDLGRGAGEPGCATYGTAASRLCSWRAQAERVVGRGARRFAVG